MKAVQINKHGGIEVIEVVDIEKPKPGKEQILIENYASSINPVDIKIREGMMPVKFPFTLGTDIAGIVVEVGEGVTGFSVGDKVYGSGIALAGATGAFAEFVAVPENLAAKMPVNINFNEAAASVLAGVSAVQAILEHFNVQSGQKILIHGGSGGIGTIAIQIAKKIGAYVAVTATGDGIEFAKNLGADQLIDYKNQSFEELLSDYEAVLDTVGGETYQKSFKVLKRGGIIVSMVEQSNKELMEKYGIVAISQFTKVNTERLNVLTKFIENGDVKVHIDKIFPFDNIKSAFEAKEKSDIKGKIVIEIK